MAIFRGIGFPFAKSATSFPGAVTDEELVRQSIIRLLSTGQGERVMRPTFGTNAIAFIFGNNDAALVGLLATEVSRVIGLYEPRARILSVTINQIESEVEVNLSYSVVTSDQLQQLVIRYPVPTQA